MQEGRDAVSGKKETAFVFVGLMGAGKTTIGRLLARATGRKFFDSDHEIEIRTGVKIPVIFDIEGEDGFRRRERKILAELLEIPNAVISTGGGIVLSEDNRAALRRKAVTCYLRASPKTLYQRTRHDKNRPLLQVENPLEALSKLLVVRAPLYEEVADLIVNVDREKASDIVKRLSKLEIFGGHQDN